MSKKKNKTKKKTGLPNPYIIKLQELVLPTFISLAIISSLILIFSTVKKADDPNIKIQDVQTTTSTEGKDMTGGVTELQIKTITEGKGDRVAKAGDNMLVHYTGKLIDGTVFDSSVEKGTPFPLELGKGLVIAGWEQGILGMKAGEKRELTIPYTLAYGETGSGLIPPKATLIFEVELVEFK